ncbi:GNAT family N-acetyltransferase [Haloprofundus salilacus]|uniref:GNAT family N-acetyltransferase n=1 Tax=Haloprofundus salilacus TaxID=2876190 RepID=UPI001CCF1843|nr:GNAT family N-acetyltransferase [Haloprofundus salilacus]
MSISVARLSETSDADDWNSWVERSSMGTPFHQFEILQVIATEADATLHPLVGYKGEEPVGLLPVFQTDKGPLRIVKSPPEAVSVRKLGPVLLNHEELKTRKREKRNSRFVDECLAWIEERCSPHRTLVQTNDRYDDFRPWVWNDFDVEMDATYVVDLERDLDDIERSFSGSVRRSVRKAEEAGCSVEVGGRSEARRIAEHVEQRFAQSDIEYFDSSPEWVMNYVDAFPDGQVRPYVCLKDGEYVGGKMLLRFGDTTWWWKGGARPLADVPANELLNWRIIQDEKRGGTSRYNLHGALEARTSGAKARLSPELVPMYKLTRQHPTLELGTWLQEQVENASSALRTGLASGERSPAVLRRLQRRFDAGERLVRLKRRL